MRHRIHDERYATYGAEGPRGAFERFLPELSDHLKNDDREALAGITSHYVRGWFDVLGSGWMPAKYGVTCLGIDGHRYNPASQCHGDPVDRVNEANKSKAREIWKLIDAEYTPIDWQRDIRSGYRWDEALPYYRIAFGTRKAADIKVPWELGRLQHLPRLALAYALAKTGEGPFQIPDIYARAFRNQVLDFIALNPPRFGVHWYVAMLPAIRAANLAVAYDLFRAAGASFDGAFERILKQSLLAHGHYIVNHLEWWDFDERNNHYLANIAGLIFIAAYLPLTSETRTWLAFGYRELLREVRHQFNDDGSGFEASSGYHAFSGEMVAWTTAIIKALPHTKREALTHTNRRGLPYRAARRAFEDYDPALKEVVEGGALFPSWFGSKLAQMYGFLCDMTDQNNRLIQVGDNDSGRFLRLIPSFIRRTPAEIRSRYTNLSGYYILSDASVFWDDKALDYRSSAGALHPFSGIGIGTLGSDSIEAALVWSLKNKWPRSAKDFRRSSNQLHDRRREKEKAVVWKEKIQRLRNKKRSSLALPFPEGGLHCGLRLTHYPDFGIFIFRSDRLLLSVRCASSTNGSRVSHPHDDPLSVTLSMGGKALIFDPGTYVYSGLPEARCFFRGRNAHFVPLLHTHHATTKTKSAAQDTLFEIPESYPTKSLVASDSCFLGRVRYAEGTVYRWIEIRDRGVRIVDFSDDDESSCPHDIEAAYAGHLLRPYSAGYGKLLNIGTCL